MVLIESLAFVCRQCELYLKNKTFLNAHLIKEGLAEVDSSFNFKYKDKFSKKKVCN